MNTFYTIILVFLSTILSGQAQYDKTIISAFDAYRTAYLDTDRAALTEMAHPEIVEKGGGKEYYFEEVTQEYNMYAAAAMTIKDLQIKQASNIVPAGDHLQAMVPYVRTFGTSDKDHIEKSYFLVTSLDGGQTWYFTDMKRYDRESIKVFLTNYNHRLDYYLLAKD